MFDRLFSWRGRLARASDNAFDLSASIRGLLPHAGYTAIDRQRDFQTVFRSTPAGRRVLAQLLERCRVCDRSYVPGDSLETARREGLRDAGLWLVDILAEDSADRPRSAQADAPDAGTGERP